MNGLQSISNAQPHFEIPKLLEMQKHISCIAQFASYGSDERRLEFRPLGLHECTCGGFRAYDRLTGYRRDDLEDAVVKHLGQTEGPIRLLSLGCGGLLSDFLTLEKLVLKGFRTIELDCVDPLGIDPEKVERIVEFFTGVPNLSVTINAYTSIDETRRTPYSAAFAIDFGGLAEEGYEVQWTAAIDLLKAYRQLETNGCLALGYGPNDAVLFGPEMEDLSITPKPSHILQYVKDMVDQLPAKEELSIGLSGLYDEGLPLANLMFLGLALAVEKSKRPPSRLLFRRLQTHLQVDQLAQKLFPKQTSCFTNTLAPCDFAFFDQSEKAYASRLHLLVQGKETSLYLIHFCPEDNSCTMVRHKGNDSYPIF